MTECRHGLSEDCPGFMGESELSSITERVEALRESEVTWIVKELGDSIAKLGYPVGMGIAPHTDQLKRAAEALFERWCKMVSKIASFAAAQCALDTERLDWLDKVNTATNERVGTCYGWKFDINHNRASLSDHNLPALHVRAAIDAARGYAVTSTECWTAQDIAEAKAEAKELHNYFHPTDGGGK